MEKKIIEILEKYHCKLYEGHSEDDTVYGIDDSDHKKIAREIVKLLNIPIVSVNEADWRKLPMHERDSLNANWRTNNLGKNSVVAVCEIGKHDCRFLIPNGNRCDYIHDCKHKKQTEL